MLECRGVTVRFGGVTALDNVNFTARKPAVNAIIGPNGAGKTTLLNAISGLVNMAQGEILFQDKDIAGLPPFKRGRAGVVRTFQNLEVFTNMSVLENVMTGCHRRVKYSVLDAVIKTPRYFRSERRCRELAMEALDFVGIAHMADHAAAELPFGSLRLLELARAISSDPDLLLLDEPAAGLNMRETRTLGQLIARIRDELGKAVVLVEHDMDLVMNISDTIIVLQFGQELTRGTPQEVQNNPDVIAAYLGEEDDDDQQQGPACRQN
ncbi:MAG: ABC transporter ATP-binding protein [Desulfovibrio sp.]|nr:MAG: ABC transporter ATP-binding protein [Desulfovibrio sp.]